MFPQGICNLHVQHCSTQNIKQPKLYKIKDGLHELWLMGKIRVIRDQMFYWDFLVFMRVWSENVEKTFKQSLRCPIRGVTCFKWLPFVLVQKYSLGGVMTSIIIKFTPFLVKGISINKWLTFSPCSLECEVFQKKNKSACASAIVGAPPGGSCHN